MIESPKASAGIDHGGGNRRSEAPISVESRAKSLLTPALSPREREKRSQCRGKRITLIMAASIFIIAFCAPSARGEIVIKDLKVPIPYEQTNGQAIPTGRYRALLTGKEVRAVPNEKSIYAVQIMRIENYQLDGSTNLIARAPECMLDRENHRASSTNRLELESPNGLYIEGTGFLCFLTNFNLIISNDVRTFVQERMLRANPELSGVPAATNKTTSAPGTNIAMTVFSERFELDYPSNIITYTGRVRLEHSQIRLLADLLTVRRGTNGALDRVVAKGHVVVINKLDNSQANGDLAVYTPEPGERIELSGHATWHDDERQSRADLFVLEPRTKHLRAEGSAWMSLPRQSVAQPDFWNTTMTPSATNTSAKAGTNQPKASLAKVLNTNAPVEISAALLDLQMPTTNQPNRLMIAERNVVILSPSDRSRASANRAVFDERIGMLQLTGDASWTAGERAARGQMLQYDRTNKIFSAHQDAFLRVPIAELGNKATPGAERGSPRSAKASSRAGPTGATNAPSPPKYIEIASTDYTYTSNLLVFREQVRGTVLEENVTLATFSSAFLGLRFSNQLESAIATGKVFVDESPTFTSSSNWVARQFECEEFNARMGPGGAFDRVVAVTNVVASQQEWRRGTNQPVRSRFSADQVIADFFPRTNAVRQAVAENHVIISDNGGTARGDRAIFNGTNNIVELTGHPQVDFPERNIKVNEAEVLIWDRTRHELFGKGMKGEGTISTNRPARPTHADGSRSTNRPANAPGLPIRPESK